MKFKINVSEFLKISLMLSIFIGFGSVISVVNPLISDGLTIFLIACFFINGNEIKFNKRMLFFIVVLFALVLLSAVFTRSRITDYFGIFLRSTTVLFIIAIFQNDYYEVKKYLIKALWIITYLAIVNFVLTLVVSQYFFEIVSDRSGYRVATLGLIFNYLSTTNVLGIEIFRNQSIFWEPGVLQIPMNVLVYYLLLEEKKRISSAFLPIFIIGTTFSTTGFIILVYILARSYWLSVSPEKNVLKILPKILFFIVFLCLIVPFIGLKFNDDQQKNSSIARQYDMLMSVLIIKENPIIGIGINEENYFKALKNKSIDLDDFPGSDEHGNTNTILSVIMKFGIPLALIFLYLLFNQNIFNNKWDFFILIITSLMSEPLLVVYFVFLLMLSSVKMISRERKLMI